MNEFERFLVEFERQLVDLAHAVDMVERRRQLHRLAVDGLADVLNGDADRHSLGLRFRIDAAGSLHMYGSHSDADADAARTETAVGDFIRHLWRYGGRTYDFEEAKQE